MKSIQTGPRFAAAMPRRAFVKSALTAGTAAFLAPRLALGAKAAAGEKVNLACCGIGNRGAEVIRELHKTGLANIVALCDTDMGAPHTQAILKMFPDVPRFQDFRQMFDKMGKAQGSSIREIPREAFLTGLYTVFCAFSLPECQEIPTKPTIPKAFPKASMSSRPSRTRATAGTLFTISAKSSSSPSPPCSAA
jgi:hypothetical protein